ncbi:hypothetical protein COOONC_22704 [Cooperia oncophora]
MRKFSKDVPKVQICRVVPSSKRRAIFEEANAALLAGHFSMKKLVKQLSKRDGLTTDGNRYMTSACGRTFESLQGAYAIALKKCWCSQGSILRKRAVAEEASAKYITYLIMGGECDNE